MPNIYIISGCNGAGKTTASYTVLPEILECQEFVNADNIAAGISPFNPDKVALAAGRIMLERISELMKEGADFAFETTLSTRSYQSLVQKAQTFGYTVTLLYFWLESPDLAIQRVKKRVSMGGHHIPDEVVVRRYHRGLSNLLNIYLPICERWLVLDNMDLTPEIIAQKDEFGEVVVNDEIWSRIYADYYGNG
ncbi:zeta toxin family protein [Sphingobacterium arenae]|uniref:Zeta toxin family protein n=1 Tax=Sphingobacterium arenae TaxID=1280598 RepID=A0ABR7Y466_9SPHI|nr:zeta toxin family protein [Sphingobacterium arenae]MBD1426107.1 zeta toxin family protein [Sphingobacterium arenae]